MLEVIHVLIHKYLRMNTHYLLQNNSLWWHCYNVFTMTLSELMFQNQTDYLDKHELVYCMEKRLEEEKIA